MNKIKCHQCGLVNWEIADQCLRCDSTLTRAIQTSLDPFENDVKAGRGVGILKVGLVAIVLSGIGFGAYSVLSPRGPATSTPQAQPVIMMGNVNLQQVHGQPVQTAANMKGVDFNPRSIKLTPDQVRQSQKEYFDRGTHFGSGAVPPGSFERTNPRPGR